MKTLKNTLLLLMALAAFSQAKAQCVWGAYASSNGANAQFYAYIDTLNLPTGSYYWDFGDGNTSTDLFPLHTYSASGTYNYCFHYNSAQCSGDSCASMYVDVCDFNPQITYSLSNYTATLGVANPQAGATYSWSISTGGGNSITSTSANPQVTFPAYGSYSAYVAVTLLNGCSDSGFTVLYVSNPCQVHFSHNETGLGTYSFQEHDSLGTFAWDLGDGATSNLHSFSHTYAASGTYMACVTRTYGSCTSTECDTIIVDLCNFNPQITYTLNNTIATLGVANPQSGATYSWTIDTGGGNSVTSTSANPQVTFPNWGYYAAQVSVTLLNGCTDATSSYINVANPCGAHFYYNQSGLGSYYFRELDSLGTFAWDLGDGSTSNQYDFNHTYAASGTYMVCLTRDYNGCTSSSCDTIVVDLCGFSASVALTNLNDTMVQFYSSVGSGQSATYSWSIPGATPSTYSVQNPLVVFPNSGTYNYCLTVVSAGCTKQVCDTVHVQAPPPVPCNAHFYFYNVTSTGYFFPADTTTGRIYAWDFGDGSTSTQMFPQHSYANGGGHIVCLTISAGNGSCSDSHCDTIFVSSPPCGSYISHFDIGLGQISFTATLDSFNNNGTYTWDFGDGTTGTGYNPLHTYATSGNYTACITHSGSGCPGTLCDSFTVDACYMNSNIGYSVNGYQASLSATNYSNATYAWTFVSGSPATSSLPMPDVTFPSNGYYEACLTITSGSCTSHSCSYVYIPNPCHAQFGYYQTDSSLLHYTFNPYDSMLNGQQTYAWTFGDGSSATGHTVNHDYATAGSTTVCLIATGANCADTVCQNINVAPLPPPTYFIGGHVAKGSPYACAATVFLIKDSVGFLSLINITNVIDSGLGTCNGDYGFWGVPQGTYYIKAALDAGDIDYASFMPTYYGDVLNWSSATPITVNSNVYPATINLIAGVNPGGPGFVGGWVSQGAGLALGGSNIGRSTGDPLPNIQVNLLTINDVPVASARTDANGRYTFSNLALGTYKVYAEEINKVPYALDVTLTANNPSQDNVDVSVNSTSAVTGLDDLSDIHLEGVFPNPVTDKTVIGISLKQNSKVLMSLTDVDGRQIQNKNLDLTPGNNEIKLDLSNEMAGVYNLSLTNDASKKIIRLVKIK